MDNHPRISFRELVAAKIFDGTNATVAASAAQQLATTACAVWGHSFDLDPKYYKAVCHRCGTKAEPK